jgi:RNA polymerase sigma-70 factor (ECF subfamily)
MHLSDLSDDDILRRVQRGERSEFLEIFDRYYPRIEGYAQHQLRNAEAARDIASETFLRAYRNVDSFRIGENISYVGYLFLVCRRLILTERQRLRSAAVVSWDQAIQEHQIQEARLADTDALPLARLLDTEKRDMVRQALQRLSADDREIISLAFERDLSRRDIAQILGKPSVSAVTSHLHRAMQKLKTVLIQQGYFNNAAHEAERETC